MVVKGYTVALGLHRWKGRMNESAPLVLYIIRPNTSPYVFRATTPVNEVCIWKVWTPATVLETFADPFYVSPQNLRGAEIRKPGVSTSLAQWRKVIKSLNKFIALIVLGVANLVPRVTTLVRNAFKTSQKQLPLSSILILPPSLSLFRGTRSV